MDEQTKNDSEDLEVEALNDADLETVAGGGPNIADSNAANACCPISAISISEA
jgi:hypothetical protein